MINIKFDYEYNCGGYTYSKDFDLPDEDFENDKILVLVCSYMQTEVGYPGKEIDQYLHNKFPNVHTLDDMYGESIYNVYNCTVTNLKPFSHVCDGLLGMSCKEGEQWMRRKCVEYNIDKKGQERNDFSIWDL